MKVETFKDAKKEHRVRVTAANGNIIYSSTEGYKNRNDAVKAAVSASIAILEHYRDTGDIRAVCENGVLTVKF